MHSMGLRFPSRSARASHRFRARVLLGAMVVVASLVGGALGAQGSISPLELVTGRSYPISGALPISKVTVVNPEVADVVVIGDREVVVNAIAPGQTDVILWSDGGTRRHYRVTVRSMQDRRQILLSVKFAEIRKDALRNMTMSLRAKSSNRDYRAGTGVFRDEQRLANDPDKPELINQRFVTLLTTFGTRELFGLLDVEEQKGNARLLAEPNLMAANLEEASFLAGGEFPIPVVQAGGVGGQNTAVTIQFREFGIRLRFKAEVLSDSLIKIKVVPEVSSLDFVNGVTIQGFQVPALRSRRVESTVDVLSDRSLIISGLFNDERERVKTGIPFLMDIPILGELFASNRWVRNESELLVVVTPILMDPNNPRAADLMEFTPDSTLPARPAIEKRLPSPIPRGTEPSAARSNAARSERNIGG